MSITRQLNLRWQSEPKTDFCLKRGIKNGFSRDKRQGKRILFAEKENGFYVL